MENNSTISWKSLQHSCHLATNPQCLMIKRKKGFPTPHPPPHPYPPTPPLTRVKYVCTVSILYWRGVGEGGDDCNLRTDERGGYKTTKNIFMKLHPKICHLATLLIVWNLPPWWKDGQDFCPPPPLLHSLNLNMRVLCTIQGAGGGGREWPSQPLVPLPFPPGIYIIIYSVPTYAYTVYVYVYIMGLGGGGERSWM